MCINYCAIVLCSACASHASLQVRCVLVITMGDSGKTKTELRQNRVFRRIEKDIKDKNRKRKTAAAQGDRDELYVDKDRAIAVGHGNT